MKKIKQKELKNWGLIWFVNAIIIFIISLFYPTNVVLGNNILSRWAALIITSLILTLVIIQIQCLAKTLKLKLKDRVTSLIVYSITNILVLWIIARAAVFTGFGLSSVLIAIIMGIILGITQTEVKSRFFKK